MAEMHVGRMDFREACLDFDGCIWVFGGKHKERGTILKSVERYDPIENKWTRMPYVYYLCVFFCLIIRLIHKIDVLEL